VKKSNFRAKQSTFFFGGVPYFFYSRPEGIPKASGVCPRFVQDMAKMFLLIPFDSLPALFSKKIAQTLARFNLILYLCHR
jgi:hypothetical protein